MENKKQNKTKQNKKQNAKKVYVYQYKPAFFSLL